MNRERTPINIEATTDLPRWHQQLLPILTQFIINHYISLFQQIDGNLPNNADLDEIQEANHLLSSLKSLWQQRQTNASDFSDQRRAELWWCCQDVTGFVTSLGSDSKHAAALPLLQQMQDRLKPKQVLLSKDNRRVSLLINWYRMASTIRMTFPADQIVGGRLGLASWLQAITTTLSTKNPSKTELAKANWAVGELIEQIESLPPNNSFLTYLKVLKEIKQLTKAR